MMSKFLTLNSLIILFVSGVSFGQANEFVQWQFSSRPTPNKEIVLIMDAKIAPGWHLYSQFIEDGGPMRTSFKFHQSDHYKVVGQPQENGKLSRFRDDIYEMEIAWYSDEVSFLQRIKLFRPGTTVTGIIEYMICNKHSCIPARKEFTVFIE